MLLDFLALLENKDEKEKLCLHDWCVATKGNICCCFFLACIFSLTSIRGMQGFYKCGINIISVAAKLNLAISKAK